jgi:hypothetical protein
LKELRGDQFSRPRKLCGGVSRRGNITHVAKALDRDAKLRQEQSNSLSLR